MDKERRCTVCRARLVGPMSPRIVLTGAPGEEEVKLEAHAWMCAACGLVHWYGAAESLPVLQEAMDEMPSYSGTPGASYERRTQVLHVLHRVRRL